MLLERVDIFYLRTTPAVNCLVIVTDNKNMILAAREGTNQGVLNAVGVLKLINQQMAKTVLIMLLQ